MDFRRKAEVQYNDFIGDNAADRSSMVLDAHTCDFFLNHPKDDNGRAIDPNNTFLRALRVYYFEDHPDVVSVEFRMEDVKHKNHDYSIEKVTLKEFFSLFKRFQLRLIQRKRY